MLRGQDCSKHLLGTSYLRLSCATEMRCMVVLQNELSTFSSMERWERGQNRVKASECAHGRFQQDGVSGCSLLSAGSKAQHRESLSTAPTCNTTSPQAKQSQPPLDTGTTKRPPNSISDCTPLSEILSQLACYISKHAFLRSPQGSQGCKALVLDTHTLGSGQHTHWNSEH